MKEIELSKRGKNKGKYVALVDDEDFDRVNKFKWQIQITKRTDFFYAKMTCRLFGKTKTKYMHNFIMGIETSKKGVEVDHVYHDGLNNQKYNLRICTSQQNCMNRLKKINSSSEYKGVYWDKTHFRWLSSIGYNNKSIHIGYFDNELEAAQAYDKKAIELFGEFALLNFK